MFMGNYCIAQDLAIEGKIGYPFVRGVDNSADRFSLFGAEAKYNTKGILMVGASFDFLHYLERYGSHSTASNVDIYRYAFGPIGGLHFRKKWFAANTRLSAGVEIENDVDGSNAGNVTSQYGYLGLGLQAMLISSFGLYAGIELTHRFPKIGGWTAPFVLVGYDIPMKVQPPSSNKNPDE
jgi:hypothetical protein